MRVVQVPISKLRFADYNPRKISEAEMAALQKSIQRFGFVDPVVVNRRDGKAWRAQEGADVIVGGHQRVRAARSLGHSKVPVVYVQLPPDEEKLLNLALNKISGEFDLQKLTVILRDLRAAQADLEASGFSQRDITRSITEAERQLAASLPPEDEEVPALPKTPRTRPGELIRLGEHRLLCGDSTKTDDLKRLMDGKQAAVLWSDPPYGVDYAGKTAEAMTIRNDRRAGQESFLRAAFAAVDRVLEPGSPIYLTYPVDRNPLAILSAFMGTGWLLRQMLVWLKDTMVLGHADYHYRHEPILYGFKRGTKRLGRGGRGWYGGQDQSTVFEVPRPKASQEHPTMKPVALVEACLRNSSERDAVVLDPFAGSGTTLIACHRLGRRACLLEIDARYCDVIRERWRRFSGRQEGSRGRYQVA